MVDRGTTLRRRGCWFSMKNIEDLCSILEDEVPLGQLLISHTVRTESMDRGGVRWRTQETQQWTDLATFKTDMQSTQVLNEVVIERRSQNEQDPRIRVEVGAPTRVWRPFGRRAFARAELTGGTDTSQRRAALRIADVLAEARFLGRWLTNGLAFAEAVLTAVALQSLVTQTSATAPFTFGGAILMALITYRIDIYLTRSIVLNDPKGVQGFVAQRSANHRASGGSRQEVLLFVMAVLGGIAGIIGTLVGILAYVFPRG